LARHPGKPAANGRRYPDVRRSNAAEDGFVSNLQDLEDTLLRDPVFRLGWRLPTMLIRDVIERHGRFAHGGNLDDTAEAWAEAGFEADEVEEWLNARCFDPGVARDLAEAGLEPSDLEETRDLVGVT
jgi:hypothetical protein